MNFGLGLAYFAAAIFLLVSVIFIRPSDALRRSVKLLAIFCLTTLTLHFLALFRVEETAARVLYSLGHIGYNCVVVELLEFAIRYTNTRRTQWPAFHLARGILGLDCLVFLANIFFPFYFSVTTFLHEDGVKMIAYTPLPGYRVHWIFFIACVFYSLGLIVWKAVRVPRFYRTIYLSTVSLIVIAVLANAAFVFFRVTNTDYSVVVSCAVCGIICLYVEQTPRVLRQRVNIAVTNDMDDVLIVFDYEGDCISLNNAAKRFLGEKYDNDPSLRRVIPEEYRQINRSQPFDTEAVYPVNGSNRTFSISYRVLKDSSGERIGSYCVLHDVTEKQRKHQAELYQATHDDLTGLFNRTAFYNEVDKILAEDSEKKYLLLCTDIENFKIVNNAAGIDAGDRVLRTCADHLLFDVPGARVISRLNNDVFALLVSSVEFDAEHMRKSTAHWFDELSLNFPIRLYVGVYEVGSEEVFDVSGMCDRAMLAINEVKGDPDRTVNYYNTKLWLDQIHNQELLVEIGEALEKGEFIFFLQPQVDSNGKPVGGEALVRWNHPSKGIIPPGVFIGVAEKSSLIAQLDLAIWEQACAKLQEWRAAGKNNVSISVNISPMDFYYLDVVDTFLNLRDKYQLAPHDLKLEITETAIMQDVDQQIARINELRAAGFVIEMDDFGSGYSSLNMLKQINVDVLKIDMCFLMNQGVRSGRARKILKTIIDLAHNLDMATVIEGVETREDVDFLREIGGNIFQGYYFAKPMKVSDFEERYLN